MFLIVIGLLGVKWKYKVVLDSTTCRLENLFVRLTQVEVAWYFLKNSSSIGGKESFCEDLFLSSFLMTLYSYLLRSYISLLSYWQLWWCLAVLAPPLQLLKLQLLWLKLIALQYGILFNDYSEVAEDIVVLSERLI